MSATPCISCACLDRFGGQHRSIETTVVLNRTNLITCTCGFARINDVFSQIVIDREVIADPVKVSAL